MDDAPVRIRNAADLFEVLTTGTPMAQMAVIQSIISHPEKPISLGPREGEDFLDLLLRLVPRSSGGVKQALTVCLMCYQDERTTRFLVEEFARTSSPQSETVSRTPPRGGSSFLEPLGGSGRS